MKAEAAKQARQARIEAALQRMRELQEYNEVHVLGRQKERCQLLDNLSVGTCLFFFNVLFTMWWLIENSECHHSCSSVQPVAVVKGK